MSYARDPKCHSDNAKNLMSLAYEKLGWQAAKEGVRMQDDEKQSSEKFKEAIKYYEKYQNFQGLVSRQFSLMVGT